MICGGGPLQSLYLLSFRNFDSVSYILSLGCDFGGVKDATRNAFLVILRNIHYQGGNERSYVGMRTCARTSRYIF